MYRKLLARDMMVKHVTTIEPDVDAHQAIDLLLRKQISGAPVVDADGTLLGVFTERDYVSVLIDQLYDNVPAVKVSAIMAKNPRTIGPEADFLSVAQIFMNEHCRRLPVVENGKLIGLVTRCDLVRAATAMQKEQKSSPPAYLYLSRLEDGQRPPIE